MILAARSAAAPRRQARARSHRRLEELGLLGAGPLYLLYGRPVQLAHELRVALGEDDLQDAEHGAPFYLVGALPAALRIRLDDAPLPRARSFEILGLMAPTMAVILRSR